MSRHGFVLFLAFLAASGCDAPTDVRSNAVAVRDSVGVRIVSVGSLDTTTAFLGGEPLFRVGDSPGEYEFVRIESGSLRRDGASVIADGTTNELLLLAPDGGIARTLGGTGDGPGEFRSLLLVGWQGDTVLAYDPGSQRITTFLGDEILDASLVPEAIARVGPIYLGEGVVISWFSPFSRVSDESWITMDVIRHSIGSETTDTVLVFDFVQSTSSPDDPSNPVGAAGTIAAGPDLIAHGRGDRAEVQILDHNGNLLQISRWTNPREPMTDEFWEQFAAWWMENGLAPTEEGLSEMLSEWRASVDEPLPHFSNIYLDSEARVWLEPLRPNRLSTNELFGFDADGEWLGWIRLQEPIRILSIGSDRILGVATDDFGVESVVMIPLERG